MLPCTNRSIATACVMLTTAAGCYCHTLLTSAGHHMQLGDEVWQKYTHPTSASFDEFMCQTRADE